MTRQTSTGVRVVVVGALVVLAACGGSSGSADPVGGNPGTEPPATAAPEDDEPPSDAGPEENEPEVVAEEPVQESAPETAPQTEPEPEPVPPVEFPLTITDALGTEFTFDGPVSFGCVWTGCSEVHADLGIREGAASVSFAADGDTSSPFLYPVGPPEYIVADYLNVEDWAGADIDAVVSRVPQNPGIEAAAGGLLPTFYLHAPSYAESSVAGFDAYRENIWLFGQLLGEPQAAADTLANYDAMMVNLSAMSTPELASRTVSVIRNGEEYQPYTEDTPFCDVIQATGLGTCVIVGETAEMNAEAYLAIDPDWIVYYSGAVAASDRSDPVWPELSAVQNNQVVESVDASYHCCGARSLLLALQEFVHATVPDSGIEAPGPGLEFVPAASPLFER